MQILGVCGDVLPTSSSSSSSSGGFRLPDFKLFPSNSYFEQRPGFSCGFSKNGQSGYGAKLGIFLRRRNYRSTLTTVRASLTSDADANNNTPIAPLQFQSPTGQFLSQILHTHPHLIPAAIDQQLETLQADRDAANKVGTPLPSQDLLYRRIAKQKSNPFPSAVRIEGVTF